MLELINRTDSLPASPYYRWLYLFVTYKLKVGGTDRGSVPAVENQPGKCGKRWHNQGYAEKVFGRWCYRGSVLCTNVLESDNRWMDSERLDSYHILQGECIAVITHNTAPFLGSLLAEPLIEPLGREWPLEWLSFSWTKDAHLLPHWEPRQETVLA